MVRVNLDGINTTRKRLADGTIKTYYYHRATGKRLRGERGSKEFIQDYAEAEKTVTDRLQGTVAKLIKDFSLSPEFAALAESTQSEYRRNLTAIERKFATLPIVALNDPAITQEVMAWRAKVNRESGPRAADYRMSVFSSMVTWARENGIVNVNHIKGFKRLYKSNRSDMIWLPENIQAFMGAAPLEMQKALILALHTGQRQGDIRRMSWSNYDGQYISIRQGKTGTIVQIPCTAALRAEMDSWSRDATVILTTKTGLAFKPRYFKRLWAETSQAAGIDELHFHDLRGTAVTMLAEAGCTAPEIASITGHSLKTASQILDRYLSRTRHLADNAILRFQSSKSAQFANRLQTGKDLKPKE